MKTAKFIERISINNEEVSVYEVYTDDKRVNNDKIYFTLTDDQFNTYFDEENKTLNTPLFSVNYYNE